MGSATFTAGTSDPSATRSASASRRRFSAEAEALVEGELARRGWEIVARNARFVGSELDLVVKKGRTLAVVEVKARRSAVAVDPAALLPRRKLVSLRRGALALLSRERFDVDTVRLDLAVVTRRMRDGAVATHVDYRAGISWPEP